MNDKAKPPTIVDIARLSGVSIGTVSRVINDEASVNPEIRETVQAQIRKLGYQPNSVAQSMRKRSTRTIGCIIRDIAVPEMAELVKAAQDTLQEADYTLLLVNSEYLVDNEVRLARSLVRRRVDGLFWMMSSETDLRLRRILQDLSIPVVLLDRENIEKTDAVVVDHFNGTRVATEYLLGLGHRRIALITTSSEVYTGRERIRGYLEAHRTHGVKARPELIRSQDAQANQGFRETSMLISDREAPTAMIVSPMGTLPGVLRALRGRNLRIPEDMSVISEGDSDLAQFFSPPISVIRWDLEEFGRSAAHFLLGRLQGRSLGSPKKVCLPTELLTRQSCAPPRTSS